jgi:hypothetical protein
VLHFGERLLQREFILQGLRAEVRDFAKFVLRFRNQRRGITPGIDTLVKWYAEISDKQAGHVRRYVPKLMEAGVLAGTSLVGPLFQFTGRNATTRDHMREEAVACQAFFDERRRSKIVKNALA